MEQVEFTSNELIKETWLSRKPSPLALLVAVSMTLVVALGSFIYSRDLWQLAVWMPASHYSIFVDHQIWRLWTTLFVHADEKHLLSNCFLFFILGYFLNGYFSGLVFPFMAIVIGGLTNLVVLWKMPAMVQLIGISGVVFWMGGAWLILYFMLDRRRSIYQRALRSFGVGLLLFVPAEAFDPSISYRAHFIGFIFGVATGLIYYFANRKKFLAAEVKEVSFDEI